MFSGHFLYVLARSALVTTLMLVTGYTASSYAEPSISHTYSLASTGDDWTLLVDTKSIESEGALKSVWLLWVYDSPRDIPAELAPHRPGLVRYEEAWTSFRCDKHDYLSWDRFERDDSNEDIAGGGSVPEEPWHPIEPNDLNGVAYNIVCSGTLPASDPAFSVSQAVSEALFMTANGR